MLHWKLTVLLTSLRLSDSLHRSNNKVTIVLMRWCTTLLRHGVRGICKYWQLEGCLQRAIRNLNTHYNSSIHFWRNCRYPMDLLKFPTVPGPLAVDLWQSLTPQDQLCVLSLAFLSDICSGLGFHSRGGQRESICSFLKKSLAVPWVLIMKGCRGWGVVDGVRGLRNPHYFSCWHHWCAFLQPFPINATTTQRRLSYPPTAPDWQASDSSGDEEERVRMEIERCHVWTLHKEARLICCKNPTLFGNRPSWLFEDFDRLC